MNKSLIKERLMTYLASKRLSVRQFEQICSLGNGVASRISPTTSPATLRKIEENSDLNIEWLLTGNGDMTRKIRNEVEDITPQEESELRMAIATGRARMVPLINIDSVGGMQTRNAITVSEQYTERLIPFTDALPDDLCIYQSGDSMSPAINAGAVLLIRQVLDWEEYFGYGGTFVLWLKDGRRITKQILKYTPDPKNFVVCRSFNSDYQDEELPKRLILQVWKVIKVLSDKGW